MFLLGCRSLNAAVLQLFLAFRIYEASYGNPLRFAIVSSMRTARISYCVLWPGNVTLPSNSSFLGNASSKVVSTSEQAPICGEVRPLIDAGTIFPQGIAVDTERRRLHVADPGAKRIYTYDLKADRLHKTLVAANPRVSASGVESRWVTTDVTGAMYFSDEARQLILYILDAQLATGNTTPNVLYNGANTVHVSSPGGVVTDTFATYWVNKASGQMVGSLVRGGKTYDGHLPSTDTGTLYPLSTISDKSYGACMSKDRIYFTQQDKVVYMVGKTGGKAVIATSGLTNPRGCAWDGDNTVLIADRVGAVFAVPAVDEGGFRPLKALDFEDAFGVAVYSYNGVAVRGGFVLSAVLAVSVTSLFF